MLWRLRENKEPGQVILEVSIVLICLALLAIASTKLFANLNLNTLERWKAYRESRIHAANDPRKLAVKSLKMPTGGSRPMSDPLSFLYYAPHTRIITEEARGGYAGLSAYISEDDLFEEPRLLRADILLEEYDMITNLITAYKLRQMNRYFDLDPVFTKRLAGEASLFNAKSMQYIVNEGDAAAAGVNYAAFCFTQMGHAMEAQDASARGDNGYSGRFKLEKVIELIDDVLKNPTPGGPFVDNPNPADYKLDPADPDYAKDVIKLQREHRLARSNLLLLRTTLNSDKEAGSVSVLLTEGEIATEQGEHGTQIDKETLSRKYHWGDSLCKGIWTDGEMAFDGLKIIPKCIDCKTGIEDFIYMLYDWTEGIYAVATLLERVGDNWATPFQPLDDTFQDVLGSQGRVVIGACQPLCWKPILASSGLGADWYLAKEDEEGKFMTGSKEEPTWVDATYSMDENGITQTLVEPGHSVITKTEMVFLANAGRDKPKRIAYGPAKAKRAIEEALIFMETKDPYSLMSDAVTKNIRKLGEAAYTKEELTEMVRASWEDAQAGITAASEKKNPVLSGDLTSEISGLTASCAGAGRGCGLEEIKTLIAGAERMAEAYKAELELTPELADTFNALSNNFDTALERLEDEDEVVRQRYTHYLDMAYVEIEGLRMIAERP